MVTYFYERQDIIQMHSKYYRESDSAVKKNFVRLSPLFTGCWWIVGQMFPLCQFNSVYHKMYNIIIIDAGRLDITTLCKLPGVLTKKAQLCDVFLTFFY
jgi:hypothetical protein